jgi:long-chain fatty acid transport protein
MKSWRLWVGLLVFLLPAAAFADDVHYQDFIVGDQAVGLGGAYTAIAADPSGLWYNPAGIVDVHSTSLSLSANLYGIQDASVGKKETILPEDPISKLSVVPSSAGFVQALGRTDMHGKRPFAFGVSFIVPSYRKFSSSEEGTSQDPVIGTYRHGYHRAFEDQTLWVSIGGAMRLHQRLSVGAAVVLIHRSVQDAASSFVATGFDGTEYLRYRSAMMDLNFSNDSLLLAVGLKLKLSERLFFGAMVRSPSVTIYSSGNMRFARSQSDGAGQSGFLPTPEEIEVKSQSQIWGEGRAGIAYVIPKILILSADVSVHMPTAYTLVEVDNPQARNALLIAPEVNRNPVINGNLGAEVQFLKRFTLGVGVFSNFSSAKTIGDPTRPAPARVHMLGGTLAVGIFSEHTITRIGMTYAQGSGSDVIPVNNPDQLALDAQQFIKVDLTQSYAYFFLASTFRY